MIRFFISCCMLLAATVWCGHTVTAQQPQYANMHPSLNNLSNISYASTQGFPQIFHDTAYQGGQWFLWLNNWTTGPSNYPSAYISPSVNQAVSITRAYFYTASDIDTVVVYNFTLKFQYGSTSGNAYVPGYWGNGFMTGMQQVCHRDTLVLTNIDSGTWIGFDLDSAFAYDPTQGIHLMFEVTRDSFSGTGFLLWQSELNFIYGNPPYDSTSTHINAYTSARWAPIFGFDVDTFWNVAASSFVSPTGSFCSGGYRPVKLRVQNAGNQAIDSMRVYWQLDGVQQPTIYHVNNMAAFGFDTVSLGNVYFATGSSHTIKAWVGFPNGTPDVFNGNDTLQSTFSPSYVFTATLPPDTSICLGAGYTFGVSTSPNAATSYLWDNNGTQSTRTVTATGTYSVTVANSIGCTAGDSIYVGFYQASIPGLGNDTSICTGLYLSLPNPQPTAVAYLWDDNSTQSTRTVGAAGTYWVRTTDALGCLGRDTIVVGNYPLPTVAIAPGDTAICPGDAITLYANGSYAAWLWDDGATTASTTVSTEGTHWVQVTGAHGCVGYDEAAVAYRDGPSGALNAVHGDTATYTFDIVGAANLQEVYWAFGDGQADTGLQVQHAYAQNGIYTVTATLVGTCDTLTASRSRTVDVWDVAATGIAGNEGLSPRLELYPNPANDMVTILAPDAADPMLGIRVYDMLGQLVLRVSQPQAGQQTLSTKGLSAGSYVVRIATRNGTAVKRLEVVR
ncbi:MAG: T9SS type A sorting domain-containing protein [Edaphocola sp.]